MQNEIWACLPQFYSTLVSSFLLSLKSLEFFIQRPLRMPTSCVLVADKTHDLVFLNSDAFLFNPGNVADNMADPFSFLASTSSSRSTSRAASTKPQKNNNGFDAFQDLVSFGNAGASPKTDLTLAERAARAEQSRKSPLNNPVHVSSSAESSFWDKFDTPSMSTHPSSNKNKSTMPVNGSINNDEWDLHWDFAPSSPPIGPKSQTTTAGTSWDINFVTSESSNTQNLPIASANKHTNLLDSDDLSSLVDFSGPPPPTISYPDTPGSFDFGESDDRYNEDVDDILGDLGKPVEVVRKAVSEVLSMLYFQ